MIILGAGPIATEMGQAFCRLGTEVHMIQRSAQILSKEDKDMADSLMEKMSTEGVHFYLDSSVQGIRDLGKEKEVVVETACSQLVWR